MQEQKTTSIWLKIEHYRYVDYNRTLWMIKAIKSSNHLVKLVQNNTYDVFKNIYSCSEIEREIAFAILNGYLQDKEIELFLKQFISIKNSTVRYSVKKLLCKFKVTSRTELFRILLCSDFVFHVPKSIYTKIKNNNFDLHVVVF